jgi:hypothetical protein
MPGIWVRRVKLTAVSMGLALAFAGCASIERQEAEKTEQLLAASGFKMKLPDTPQKTAELQAMKQEKILPRTKDGTLYFLYADAKGCGCLYVGNQANYDAYQKLSVQREIAIADQEEALDAEDTAELNWGAWGYPVW